MFGRKSRETVSNSQITYMSLVRNVITQPMGGQFNGMRAVALNLNALAMVQGGEAITMSVFC